MQLSDQVLSPKLWPTPRANDPEKRGDFKPDPRHGLPSAAKLWPTPRANENDQGPENREKVKEAAERGMGSWTGQGRGATLTTMAKLWPTPQAHDATKGNPERVGRFGTEHGGRNLNDTIGGSLNPRFVEELMGYPIDHTALKRSATAWSPSRYTRSSRRSRKPKGLVIPLIFE
jgi:hypothetical protein